MAATRSPLKKNGSEAGQLDLAERLQPRGAEAPHQLEQLGVDRAQAVEHVDRDREEADQGHDRQLGPDSVVEGQHEDRGKHDDRDRLGGHQQRVGRLAQRPAEVHREREEQPRRDRDRQAEQHLVARDERLVEEQVAVVAEGLDDLHRARRA